MHNTCGDPLIHNPCCLVEKFRSPQVVNSSGQHLSKHLPAESPRRARRPARCDIAFFSKSIPDPTVLTALEAIRTTPVKNSMYARLYEYYAQPDATAIAYDDWDTRPPWMSLLKDIRDYCSILWWASSGDSLVAFVNLTMITVGQTHHKRRWRLSSTAPSRSGI